MNRYLIVAAAVVGMVAGVSCSKKEGGTAAAGGGGAAPAPGVVKRIELPKYQADLPDAEGREQFATSCLACHSTTYIGMQPALTAAKWEDEVRKMMKVYGAPIGEEQVAPIVKYLMAVKEGDGPKIHEGLAAAPAGNAVVKPARDQNDRASDATRGEQVFGQYCASCHGVDGRGGGPAGLVLMPRPADLTAGTLSDEGVGSVVCNGMPGTAMAAFGKMPAKDLQAVEAYVLTLATDEPAAAQTADGRVLFMQNCASCHGVEGRGDGQAGLALARPAADFHMRRPTGEHARQVIAEGVAGTAMPAWKTKLDEGKRKALAEFVRGFFEE